MAIYTVSPDLLRNIEKGQEFYFTDILFVFAQKNNHFKVAKDKKGVVIDKYASIEENKESIATWLNFMACQPATFEPVEVDVSNLNCEETMFLKVCKETQNHNKLIYYSTQNIKKHNCKNNIITFENKAIQILDRDQARQELTPSLKSGDTNYISGSQVAMHGSNITESDNKQNDR